jgi:hypothetical protein
MKASAIPTSLVDGDRAYKKDGADGFLQALLRGSFPDDSLAKRPMLEQATAVNQLLKQVELLYGRYKGMEPIGTLPITNSTRVVYFTLNYERGPVFGVLSVYISDGSEIITGYAVNTEVHKVVPTTVLVDRMEWWSAATPR